MASVSFAEILTRNGFVTDEGFKGMLLTAIRRVYAETADPTPLVSEFPAGFQLPKILICNTSLRPCSGWAA